MGAVSEVGVLYTWGRGAAEVGDVLIVLGVVQCGFGMLVAWWVILG